MTGTGDVAAGPGASFFRPRAKKVAGTIRVPASEGQNMGVDNPSTSVVSFQKTAGKGGPPNNQYAAKPRPPQPWGKAKTTETR
jgi:hypothetical protein